MAVSSVWKKVRGWKGSIPGRTPAEKVRRRMRQLVFEPLESRLLLATDMVSTVADPLGLNNAANGASYATRSAVTSNGRYVAFGSWGSNLVLGDTNRFRDIFVRDLWAGNTARVSTSSTGAQTNGCSDYPAISGDGRYGQSGSAG